VYSISAEHLSLRDTGIFTVQAATSHGKARRTIRETLAVLRQLAQEGPSQEDLQIAKDNLLGGVILSLESPSARMGRLARNELYFGGQRPVRETVRGVERVTAAAVHEIARSTFRADNALLCVLGRETAFREGDLGLLERGA
jgi:predicted Zn-dependent peptidase